MNTLRFAGRRLACTSAVLSVVVLLLAGPARSASAWPCRDCGPQPGFLRSPLGETTPCGSQGCGPRYWGPRSEEPCGPDPCSNCNRWQDCNGVSRGPDLLAPWQLPPGRGFMSPAEVGYVTENPCDDCNKINCCLFGGPSCLQKINPCHPDCILTLFPWPWKRRAAGCGECQSCRNCQPALASGQVPARQVAAGEVAAKAAPARTAAAETPVKR